MEGAEGGREWKGEGAEGTGQGGRRARRVEWELASVSAEKVADLNRAYGDHPRPLRVVLLVLLSE